jgi:hypothetical protein
MKGVVTGSFWGHKPLPGVAGVACDHPKFDLGMIEGHSHFWDGHAPPLEVAGVASGIPKEVTHVILLVLT